MTGGESELIEGASDNGEVAQLDLDSDLTEETESIPKKLLVLLKVSLRRGADGLIMLLLLNCLLIPWLLLSPVLLFRLTLSPVLLLRLSLFSLMRLSLFSANSTPDSGEIFVISFASLSARVFWVSIPHQIRYKIKPFGFLIRVAASALLALASLAAASAGAASQFSFRRR